MEQWKSAFKQIFGKTPTKDDYSVAPSSVRESLPNTSKLQQVNGGRKRKQLVLKRNEQMDEEFTGKKRRKDLISNPIVAAATSTSKLAETDENKIDKDLLLLRRAPTVDPFLSPVKNWTGFLASPTRSAKKRLQFPQSPSAMLRTPSPAKLLRRPIICTNIGNLLTSVNEAEEEAHENYDDGNESDDEKQRKIAEEMGIEPGVEKMEENATIDGQKKKKKGNPTKRKTQKKQSANYVAINLRKRCFAPISKFGGAKKWKGKRGREKWAGKNWRRNNRYSGR